MAKLLKSYTYQYHLLTIKDLITMAMHLAVFFVETMSALSFFYLCRPKQLL